MSTRATLEGVLRADGHQRAVRFERTYRTDVADLWAAVTEPERVARWLAPIDGELRVGGRVRVHFDDGDADFEIIACARPHELAVRWHHSPERVSQVALTISATEGDDARLVLEHSQLGADRAAEYAAGWHWHLDALAASLHGEPPPDWDRTFPAWRSAYLERLSELDQQWLDEQCLDER